SAPAQQETTTSSIGAISLLGGMITADAITATAITQYSGGVFSPSSTVNLVNLVVNGMPQPVTPAEWNVIPLPGIGSVTLREHFSSASSQGASEEVHAIHVRVTVPSNPLGVAAGTNIWVGFARAALLLPAGGLLDGQAYGTSVNVAGTVQSGQSAL